MKYLIAVLLSSQFLYAEEDLSKWSLQYFAKASNSLLVAADQVFDNKKILCGLKKKEVQKSARNLQFLIDVKISQLSKTEIKEIRKQTPLCSKDCSCDIFAYYLEQSKESLDKKLLAKMSPQAEKIDSQARVNCAKKFSEFCESKLLQKIRNDKI